MKTEPETNPDEKSMDIIEKVRYLAALGWSDNDIADYMGISHRDYAMRMMSEDNLYDAVRRGRLQKRADMELRIALKAEAGGKDSVKLYRDLIRDRSFSFTKLDLFGGADKPGVFENIKEYIASGSKGNLTENEQIYIDLLTLVYSLDGQYGKRRTIKFLTSEPYGFEYSRAAEIYSEAVEMFYTNRKISREAIRAKIADEFDTLYIAARNSARSVKDYAMAAEILANKARALQLDKEDPHSIQPEMYMRPYRVLSVDPGSIGLPQVNRQELARQIDSIVAPEAVKRRLKMEAGVTDMNAIDVINNELEKED